MSVRADSRVDEYIGRLPEWQQAVCQQVRRLVHDADPRMSPSNTLSSKTPAWSSETPASPRKTARTRRLGVPGATWMLPFR